MLATVNTPRSLTPQTVRNMRQAVAAAGSANLRPAVDLDGHFIAAGVNPDVRMTETADQVLRELVSRRKSFELRVVEDAFNRQLAGQGRATQPGSGTAGDRDGSPSAQ